MVNDVTSNEEILLFEELELREARLKFRGPGAGDSEEGVEEETQSGIDEVRKGSMMSVSSEKDGLSKTEELSRGSFWR